MKKRFLVILLSLFLIVGMVQQVEAKSLLGQFYGMMRGIFGGQAGGGVVAGGSECTGYLICQNFEGTGTDNSETWTTAAGNGVADPDYTTTILRNAQSLHISCNSCETAVTYTSPTFTATSPIHLAFRFRLIANPSDVEDIILIRNGTTTLISASQRDNGIMQIFDGTGDASNLTTTAGTTYYIWIDYTKGTGANAVVDTYISTTRTKPAIQDHITNGNATLGATNIQFTGKKDSSASNGYIIDQMLISATTIGDMPL